MSAAGNEAGDSTRLIRDSAAVIVPPGGDTRRIRALRFQTPGFDRAVWSTMCEMGWPGLLIDEARGGSGLGMREYCALTEQLGAGLAPEPLIQAGMAAGPLSGDALAAQLSGARLVLPAWQERAGSLDTVGGTVIGGGRANGRKCFIPMAAGADAFLVSGRGGLGLVAADAPGVTLSLEQTQDGGNFGTLTLADAPCTRIEGDFMAGLERATLATAAYLLGVMDRVFAITLDYLRTRQQFGRPIGSFQALQHRAADLKIQVALTRASIDSAAATLDAGAQGAAASAAVSRAKARASDAAMLVTRQAIQLHGGIGYTDEADPGLYLRKAMVLSNLYGSAARHRRRYAAHAADEDE
jgi:alkylation response protein AidB-like acyl-CoA dehydrogenase